MVRVLIGPRISLVAAPAVSTTNDKEEIQRVHDSHRAGHRLPDRLGLQRRSPDRLGGRLAGGPSEVPQKPQERRGSVDRPIEFETINDNKGA